MSPDLDNHFVVADLRSTNDRVKCQDRVANALKVPWDDVSESLDVRFFPVEREVQIVVFCNDGRMAAKAKDFLEEAGYLNVFNAYSAKHIQTALSGHK
eukprot:CAMPEP_0114422750 /NCGR_PEP_ID=MMETSP0103-20121206/5776_1 /TAXON_ID=37642 ORGANISM="Paraphysomonas imperforata, Strain PA2" /NCGR_SAMPLE_ID=MMETSP0103 /ASSEMBLY_ACC=CAM_ASM_000201 /LENGTH=97 /DNA_ID=CAMNT_0001591355 /DNA_START=201 /DNA_END=494 /DNA_ORIENTATION=-